MAIFSLLIRRPKTEGRIMKTFVFGQTFWLLVYSVSHNFIYPYIFAGNQGNHQNFIPSLVPIDLWWIWIRMIQKKCFFLEKKNLKWPTQKNWVFQLPPKVEQLLPKFHRLVSRNVWCKGHWYDSTYMAVRLSTISSKKD